MNKNNTHWYITTTATHNDKKNNQHYIPVPGEAVPYRKYWEPGSWAGSGWCADMNSKRAVWQAAHPAQPASNIPGKHGGISERRDTRRRNGRLPRPQSKSRVYVPAPGRDAVCAAAGDDREAQRRFGLVNNKCMSIPVHMRVYSWVGVRQERGAASIMFVWRPKRLVEHLAWVSVRDVVTRAGSRSQLTREVVSHVVSFLFVTFEFGVINLRVSGSINISFHRLAWWWCSCCVFTSLSASRTKLTGVVTMDTHTPTDSTQSVYTSDLWRRGVAHPSVGVRKQMYTERHNALHCHLSWVIWSLCMVMKMIMFIFGGNVMHSALC